MSIWIQLANVWIPTVDQTLFKIWRPSREQDRNKCASAVKEKYKLLLRFITGRSNLALESENLPGGIDILSSDLKE